MAQAGDLFVAIVVGVAVAVLVNWLTSAEHDVTIHTEGDPLWPMDGDRLYHSVMLTVTVVVVQLASHYLQLSTTTSLVSVMLLTITPDFQSLLRKGELRVAGTCWRFSLPLARFCCSRGFRVSRCWWGCCFWARFWPPRWRMSARVGGMRACKWGSCCR